MSDLKTITKEAVRKAAEKVGGQYALASELGVTYQAIWKWERVPSRHCQRISSLSRISRKRLRPDIYA